MLGIRVRLRAREPETGTGKEIEPAADITQGKKALAFPEGILLGLRKEAGMGGEGRRGGKRNS